MTRHVKRAREVLEIEIAGLKKAKAGIGVEFARAVDKLLAALTAGGKIVVTGVGKNLPIGQKIAATLTSTGSPAVFLHPSDAMHGELGILSEQDAVIALSYSGESEELLTLLQAVRRVRVPIISLTGSKENALARVSDEVLLVTVPREACPFNMAPTASTTATLAVGDALAIVLLEARGFRKQDFAKLHPGGTIGRTLLYQVADIMRSADRAATVRKGQLVRDAMLAMTKAKSGAVAVLDAKQKVVGIFTDGDLRRHLPADPKLLERRIEEVMTARPITVNQTDLAVDVVNRFRTNRIDDLIVVDNKGRIAGMVDIQDLPKFKLF